MQGIHSIDIVDWLCIAIMVGSTVGTRFFFHFTSIGYQALKLSGDVNNLWELRQSLYNTQLSWSQIGKGFLGIAFFLWICGWCVYPETSRHILNVSIVACGEKMNQLYKILAVENCHPPIPHVAIAFGIGQTDHMLHWKTGTVINLGRTCLGPAAESQCLS